MFNLPTGKKFMARLRALGSLQSRDQGKLDRLAARLRRPIDRRWYRRKGRVEDLTRLAHSVERSGSPISGPRVLVVTLRVWVQHSGVEAVIAQALRLRGADVALLTCGGGQPICEVGWSRNSFPRPCDRCAVFTEELTRGSGLATYKLSKEFPWGAHGDRAPRDPASLPASIDPHAVGDTSAAWFVKSKEAIDEPEGPAAARDYAVSAAAVEGAASRVLDRFQPDIVFAINGLFTAEHVIRSLCDARGIRFTSYETSPKADCYVFSHGRPAPDMDTTELWANARNDPLSGKQSEELERLLAERAEGRSAPESYFASQVHEQDRVRAELAIPRGGRVATLFTNLAWDTALQGRDLGFQSMFDWLTETVEEAAKHPETTLVVRVHPAEKRWGTRQPARDKLLERVGTLPPNVRLVAPDDPLSSYALIAMSSLVLTYASTIGVEAAARGIPVAVAAQTHYRGRGFTHDIESRDEVGALLAVPSAMSAEQKELARRYAFAFFFRRLVPLPAVQRDGVGLGRVPTDATQIAPGRDAYVDFVCDRILDGAPFHLPPELALL